MNIITTAHGIQYRQAEFIDTWGRKRVYHKRLSDLPKPHAENCVVCGSPISAERSTKRFCGDACKMRDYRRRRRAGSSRAGVGASTLSVF